MRARQLFIKQLGNVAGAGEGALQDEVVTTDVQPDQVLDDLLQQDPWPQEVLFILPLFLFLAKFFRVKALWDERVEDHSLVLVLLDTGNCHPVT
jgi:hypothetical protein